MDLQNLMPYLIAALIAIAALAFISYRKINILRSAMAAKFGELEKLLLDIRDGTKKFYREKRSSPRIYENIYVKLLGADESELIELTDISYNGAGLKTTHSFSQGQIIDLNIGLPLYPQPIHARSKVVKISSLSESAGKPKFSVGIEFIGLGAEDESKLIETVDILNKSSS
jgi:hypothetical protein